VYAVLDDRQTFMLDLQKKLENEKRKNEEFEQKMVDLQVELDCTKDRLKFVQEESDKNKVSFFFEVVRYN
jgi:predicted transcriptional regulator